MTLHPRTILMSVAACLSVAAAHAAGVAGHVTTVDHKKRCVSLEWNNDTERVVCWKDTAKFSVLETGKAAKATDVRKGSYLRMDGEETSPWREMPWGREGQFWATKIVIWEEQSRPAEP